MTAEIKTFISDVEKTIVEKTSGISEVPDIKAQINDAKSHLQKLKDYVDGKGPNLDDDGQRALNNSLQVLNDKIGAVRQGITESFLASENAIQGLDPSVQEIPFVKTKIVAVRNAIEKVRSDDYKTYSTYLPVFSDFQDFFEKKIPTILERKVYLDGVRVALKQIDNYPDVIKKDTTVAKLFSQANAEVEKLFGSIHSDTYSPENLRDICAQLEAASINRQALNDVRVAVLLKTPAEADIGKIKDYISGTEEEKVWNLKLLQAYSRGFQTGGVNGDNTSGAETVNIIGSIIKAKKGRHGGENGPDAPAIAGTPSLDAQLGGVPINKGSTANELRSVYDANGSLVQFEKGAAEQVNSPKELTEMYLSLAQEHYLTLLVIKDRQNKNEDGKKSLPGFMQSRYDDVVKNTPEKGNTEFEWRGFDDNDFGPGDQDYQFSSPEDKQIFLESTMKLLPFLDAMSAQYVENSDPSLMENVFSSMSIESQYDIYQTVVTALIAMRNPIVTLLGGLGMEAFGQKFIDFPWLWFSLRGIIWAARSWYKTDKGFWGYADALTGGTTKYVSTMDTLKGAYTSEGNREIEGGAVVGEKALKKLESAPESDSAKRYALINDLIQQRMLSDVTITYTNGKTVVLKKITPQFGQALLSLQRHYLERDFSIQYTNRKDESAKQAFVNDNSIIFNLDNTTYEAMIDLACMSESFGGQVLSGNVLDTSRTTEYGFWRIMRSGNSDFSGQNSSPGTRFNMVKNALGATVGTFIRRITNRVPGRFESNPAYIYSRSGALPFWLGRTGSRDAAVFIDHVDKNRDSIGIQFLISYDEIHHDVNDLLRNDHGHAAHGPGHGHGHGPHPTPSGAPNSSTENGTVFFDNPQERTLLEHFAHAISAEHGGAGVIEQRTWEFAVVTMGYVCRGSELDPHHDETHNLHSMVDLIAHINSASLTQTNKDRIRFFYNKMKDKTAQFTAEEIIEMGKLTHARHEVHIGTEHTQESNNHIVGEGRKKMDELENKFYNDGLSVEDFKTEYAKWFKKYAKFCGEEYDPEKHVKLIEAQRVFADKLRSGSTLDTQIREGTYTHDTVDRAIEDAVGTPIKKDLSNLTAPFRNSFFDTRRQELIDHDNARVQQATTELTPKIETIKQQMIDGDIRSKADFEAQIRTTLNAIKPQKVALQFINNGLPTGTPPFASNRFQDAVTAYWNHSFNIYESRINGIILKIGSAADWEKKLDALREYLAYGESANTVLDASGLAINTRGKSLVLETYEAIHNAVKLIPTEKSKHEAFEKYRAKVASNPKPQESAFLVEMEAHFGKQKRAIVQKLETTLQGADFDTVAAAYNAEKTSVENDYGHELCQDAINAAQLKFNELEKVYVTSQVEEIRRERNVDVNLMVQNASARINTLATKVGGRHVAEIQKARNWVTKIEEGNSAVLAISVEVEQNGLPEADAKDRVKAILSSNTDYAAAFPTTAYDKIATALRAREAAKIVLEAAAKGKNMAEKIAAAITGKATAAERIEALMGTQSDPNSGLFKPSTPEYALALASQDALFAEFSDGQGGLDAGKITDQQFMTAFVQDVIYRSTGSIDLDAQHASLVSNISHLVEINRVLRNAGISEIINTNVNTHVRASRK